jgi:hypothetical protein
MTLAQFKVMLTNILKEMNISTSVSALLSKKREKVTIEIEKQSENFQFGSYF